MPSVAMIELSRSRLTRIPLISPAATAKAIAIRMAEPSLLLSPAGSWVEITTAREMPPATERSMPPCCTTNI